MLCSAKGAERGGTVSAAPALPDAARSRMKIHGCAVFGGSRPLAAAVGGFWRGRYGYWMHTQFRAVAEYSLV